MECLFENYENQPKELNKITSKYIPLYNRCLASYKITQRFLNEVEKIGYTFEYGLDNDPFYLRSKNIVFLESVGTYFDKKTKETFADFTDLENSINIENVCSEWIEKLSKKDKKIVKL